MKPKWEDVVAFHGHACPGLAKGYVMVSAAMQCLGIERAGDEETVAIVENKSCAVDAVQVVSGCTFGKGNFIYCDYGKQAITLARRADGKAIRVCIRPDISKQRIAKTISREEYIRMILETPYEEIMDIKEVEIVIPQQAQVFPTLVCENCGEGVMEPSAEKAEDHVYCLPCWQKIQAGQARISQDPAIG